MAWLDRERNLQWNEIIKSFSYFLSFAEILASESDVTCMEFRSRFCSVNNKVFKRLYSSTLILTIKFNSYSKINTKHKFKNLLKPTGKL